MLVSLFCVNSLLQPSFFVFMSQKGVNVPGTASGDRRNWEKESLHDQSHACFAKKA